MEIVITCIWLLMGAIGGFILALNDYRKGMDITVGHIVFGLAFSVGGLLTLFAATAAIDVVIFKNRS